jgi:pyruvate ferredoxin oxidoreductase gamma subunit
MAIAALEDGKYGQAFPFLGGGGERRGKPIAAFCRLSDRTIRVRSHVHEPDYVIVQDATILSEVDVEDGLKPDGALLINTDKNIHDLGLKSHNVFAISADELARRILGRPIINTALLGTFAGFSKELSLKAVLKAVRSKFPGALGEKNAQVVEESYQTFLKELP